MNNILKNAPEGATHYREDVGAYYKIIDGILHVWLPNPAYEWIYSIYRLHEPGFTELTQEKEEMTKKFTKADLKTGMVVTTRNGYKYQTLLGYAGKDILQRKTGHLLLSDWTKDLEQDSRNEWDIVLIEQPKYVYCTFEAYHSSNYDVVFKREEDTQQEKEYQEALAALEEAKRKVEKLKPSK